MVRPMDTEDPHVGSTEKNQSSQLASAARARVISSSLLSSSSLPFSSARVDVDAGVGAGVSPLFDNNGNIPNMTVGGGGSTSGGVGGSVGRESMRMLSMKVTINPPPGHANRQPTDC